MAKNKQRAIRLEPDLEEWLEKDAYNHGRNVSQSVRFYLRQEMDRQEYDEALDAIAKGIERG